MQVDVAKVSKIILFVLTVVYEQCYDEYPGMNNNCQEFNFTMKSLLLRCNKPSHFC